MDLVKVNQQLPATIQELSKFILVGREKLVAFKAEIRAMNKIGVDLADIQIRKQEARILAEYILEAEAEMGERLKDVCHSPAGRTKVLPEGITHKQSHYFQALAKNKDIIEQVKAEARENDDIPTRSEALKKIKQIQKQEQLEKAKENIIIQTNQAIEDNKPQVYNMNCIDWLDMMPDCDLLLTDPPYSTDVDDINTFANTWLYKALAKVKDTGRAYVFIGAYPTEVQAYLNATMPDHIKLEQLLVWTYKNTLGNNPKDRYKLNYQMCLYFKGVNAPELDCPITNEQWAVQEINAPDGRIGDRYHAWQKPIEIGERFIRHSTKEGDVVLDPFVCTGTFVIAANKLKRQGFGCDVNIDNLKIAIERGCELHK